MLLLPTLKRSLPSLRSIQILTAMSRSVSSASSSLTTMSPVDSPLTSAPTTPELAKSQSLPPHSTIPIFTTVSAFRAWRKTRTGDVGFVPTMGALHDGHLKLVRNSLAQNPETVVSIFVNPAQFAPHEDLATYPRTIDHDLRSLESLKELQRTVSAIFLPSVSEMYPSGSTHGEGTFVEVVGPSSQMEGKSRPGFFRGVATVVTKLFNVVQPDISYFGQKDIQQGLILRRMAKELLLSTSVQIVPTVRDSIDSLALSSRNLYLNQDARQVADTLYRALKAAESLWDQGASKAECLEASMKCLEEAKAAEPSVTLKLDYISLNDARTLEALADTDARAVYGDRTVLLSGALLVNGTRLIDNLILGDQAFIFES